MTEQNEFVNMADAVTRVMPIGNNVPTTFEEWLKIGELLGFCSAPYCDTHDGVPLVSQEMDLLELGDRDFCVKSVRLNNATLWQEAAIDYASVNAGKLSLRPRCPACQSTSAYLIRRFEDANDERECQSCGVFFLTEAIDDDSDD